MWHACKNKVCWGIIVCYQCRLVSRFWQFDFLFFFSFWTSPQKFGDVASGRGPCLTDILWLIFEYMLLPFTKAEAVFTSCGQLITFWRNSSLGRAVTVLLAARRLTLIVSSEYCFGVTSPSSWLANYSHNVMKLSSCSSAEAASWILACCPLCGFHSLPVCCFGTLELYCRRIWGQALCFLVLQSKQANQCEYELLQPSRW